MITSRQNPRLKEVRCLRTRKGREERGQFIVEGIRPVGEAIEAGAKLAALYYAPELLTSEYALGLIWRQELAGMTCYPVKREAFESIVEKENPQGLLAVVQAPQRSLAELNRENFAWGVAVLAPQDPGNIGTILRTIDGVGASGLLLLDDPQNEQYSAEAIHPNAVRASMGTLFWLPVVSTTFDEFMSWAKNQAYTIYGTSAHASLDYRTIQAYSRPAILLLGSEQKGLNERQTSQCDVLLSLPLHGRATSLNLAVAAGVFLYDMLMKGEAEERLRGSIFGDRAKAATARGADREDIASD